ncbi:hypothetical protein ZIOFF_030198 [Zingiber officinale]|uniref:Uncharacterized protein n=1 Tax=Zingiber officinale TaxID=94328 RepID=A0A8J5H310_ZINOF|nr:hypothetical protein ZIOFF_030198 [Zingiber officinale]
MGTRVLLSCHGNGSSFWHTPIPYLFGGIGAMMVLIAVALLMLACSRRKSFVDSDNPSLALELEDASIQVPIDLEPRFVVIVAGEDTPTFLAKPVPCVLRDSASLQES